MRRVLVLLSLILSAAACAPLQTLEEGTCGNGVIDTDRNEDCDTIDHDGFACETEGEWACSFKCKEGACPAGYGCGVDGICRQPTGRFASTELVNLPTEAQELMAGDFDADGRADIVGIEPGHLRITFVGAAGDVQQTSFSSPLRPSIGKLGTVAGAADSSGLDRADDLVLPLNLGIGALISGGDRTFSAKAYSSVTFDEPVPLGDTLTGHIVDVLPIAIDALPATGTLNAGDEMTALVALSVEDQDKKTTYPTTGVFVDFESGGLPIFTVEGGIPSNLAGPPVLGRFDNTPCQQIAFPLKGATHLSVYRTCLLKGFAFEWARSPTEAAATLAKIELGDAAISGPAFAFDADGDGRTDLLITTSVGGAALQLRVAYGMGNGSFNSTPPLPGQVDGDNITSVYSTLIKTGNTNGRIPLALGDLNLDGYPDLVDSRSVLFGGPDVQEPVTFTTTYTSQRSWDEAIVADVNGNGYPDIVASAKDATDIDVLGGDPSTFINPLQIPTEGRVAHLTAGDYDGDLVNDIAFEDALAQSGSRLMISYGRTAGGPEEPVKVGAFPTIDRIVAGNALSLQLDHITDLGVTSGVDGPAGPSIALSFLPGSANRFILAPFFLNNPETHKFDIPLQTALGLLEAPAAKDVHNDLAVLAESPLKPDTDIVSSAGLDEASDSLRLWAVRGAGEAEFSTSSASVCHLRKGPFFSPGLQQAISVVAPPGAPGTVIVTAPFLDPKSKADPVVSSLIAQVGLPVEGSTGTCAEGKRFVAPPGQLLFRTKMVDLNGNGEPEILAIAQEYDEEQIVGRLTGKKVEGDDKPLRPSSSRLIVFWDALGPGDLVPQPVPTAPSMLVADYAVGDINGDGLQEVIVVGSEGRILFTAEPGGQTLAADTSEDPGVPDVPVGDTFGPRAVLIADADGDGVNDLALVNELSSLQIFKGVPKTRIKD